MKERASNIELLRIIAMTFIVIWHISIHAQKGEAATHGYVAAITISGVNLFLLITGYFGLKPRWQSYLNIIAMVIFYSILSIALNYYILGNTPSKGEIFYGINPFGITTYWFINCYIILMLLAPALNIIKGKTTDKQYLYIIGILIYLSCIIGLLFRNDINRNGYCVMQFITMYYIGDAIRRYNIINRIKRSYFILAYAIATLILYVGGKLNIQGTYAYNNPVLMLAAISLFCIIANLHFSNNNINKFAKYMFPVYLLQEGFFGRQIYNVLYHTKTEEGFYAPKYLLTIFLYIIVLFVGAIVIENMRRWIMSTSIKKLSIFLDKKFNIFP